MIAVSSMFDMTLPQRIANQYSLTVVGNSSRLGVSVTVDTAELTPGSSAGFSVELLDSTGAPVAGEVAVFAVEKAFLDLKPHPPQDLASDFEVDLMPGYLPVVSNARSLVGGSTYEASKDRIASLVSKEPWLNLNQGMWPIQAGRSQAFDLTADEYLSRSQSEFITEEPPSRQYYGGGGGGYGRGGDVVAYEMAESDGDVMMMESAPMMDDAAGGRGGADMMARSGPMSATAASADMSPSPPSSGAPNPAGGGAQMNTPVRSAFETTPLFLPTLPVDSSGRVHVAWNLPDNVGTFVIRAYAVSSSGNKFGVATDAEQLTRQTVSLIPSVPRISRVGDDFLCGVTVTASDPTFNSDVTLSVGVTSGGGLALTSPISQTVTMNGLRPREVTFGFSAQSLEAANLIFTLSAGAATDALAADIPVLSAQQSVYVATSMGITASDSVVPWMEGLQLPDAVPGSGSLDLFVGVGYLPAVRTISAALTTPVPCSNANTWCSGHDLVNALIASPALEQYLSASDELVRGSQIVFDSSVPFLQQMTDVDGLRYSLRKFSGGAPYVDVYLNSWALYVVREVQARGITPSRSASVASLVSQWRTALIRGLVESVQDASRHGYTFQSWESVARARLALGVAPMAGVTVSTQSTLSMASLTQRAIAGSSCRHSCKAATALILLRENPADPSAVTLLREFADGLRVAGRTAYLSASGSPHALDMGTQSLIVQACLLASVSPIPELLLNKLGNYVAQGGDDRYGWRSRGSDGVFRVIALSAYDAYYGSNQPSIDYFKASAGGVSLLAGQFTPTRIGPLESSTNWSALPHPPPPLVLWATGTG